MTLLRILFAALFLWSGLACSGNSAVADDEFRVIASIKPVHSILAGLMEGAPPPYLLASGIEPPFNQQLDSSQRELLASANMLIWVGPELERFLVKPTTGLDPNTRIVTLLDNPVLKILPARWDDSSRDPFFWLDSRNAIILIDELTRELVHADPARSHLYKRNRAKMHDRMARLDRKLEYGYRSLQKGQGLTYHDTQQYFEQAYAVRIGEASTDSPSSTMAAADLLDSRRKLQGGEYSCVLVEEGLGASHLELLVSGVNINIGYLDSFGVGYEAGIDLYFNVMEHNTRTIESCMQGPELQETSLPDSRVDPAVDGIGGRFLLVDQDGGLFSDKDLLGKYQLILFGYVFCPDVCPTSLLTVSQALELMREKSKIVQPYFITVDPDRDTPEVMNKYVRFFSDDLIGLTGTRAMISRVARQYNVKYEKLVEEGADDDAYAMDHTSSFFFMAPDGRFITKFAYGITPEQLAEKLNEYIR
jgi:protein SCO1/2